MAEKATSALPTLTIRVAPDHLAPLPDPQVLLSNRNARASGTPARIVWKKLPAAKKFEMVDLIDLNATTVFKNVSISANKKKIECDFEPPAGATADTEYEYQLVINYDKTDYNTDYRGGGPAGGKAVIRN